MSERALCLVCKTVLILPSVEDANMTTAILEDLIEGKEVSDENIEKRRKTKNMYMCRCANGSSIIAPDKVSGRDLKKVCLLTDEGYAKFTVPIAPSVKDLTSQFSNVSGEVISIYDANDNKIAFINPCTTLKVTENITISRWLDCGVPVPVAKIDGQTADIAKIAKDKPVIAQFDLVGSLLQAGFKDVLYPDPSSTVIVKKKNVGFKRFIEASHPPPK